MTTNKTVKATKAAIAVILTLGIMSCHSTQHFDDLGNESEAEKKSKNSAKSRKEELRQNSQEIEDLLVEERMKEVDVEKTVVYVDRPIYRPIDEKDERPKLSGKEAAQKSTGDSIQKSSVFTGGTMWYDFDSDFTYEIYCQPYRVTDMSLEPGEQVIEMPFLSEEKVWEIGAGVSRANNVDTQHFFLKPAYSGLTTSLIIITDKRVYHILLKSYKDCYMTQVKWKYPNTMPFTLSSGMNRDGTGGIDKITEDSVKVDPRFLSFDYKMSYSRFKKPYWLPKRVYDDGRRTYIVMDETVLHMTTPVLFNKKDHRINYSVDKTLIVINELVEKVTLRVGREKVVIKKKTYKEPTEPNIPKDAMTESTVPDAPSESKGRAGFMDSLNSGAKRETMLHSDDVVIERHDVPSDTQTEGGAQ